MYQIYFVSITIVILFVVPILCYRALDFFINVNENHQKMSYVVYVDSSATFITLISLLVTIFETWLNRFDERKIIRSIQMIDKLLAEKYHIQMNYQIYQRNLRISLLLVFAHSFLYGGVRYIYNIPGFLITDYFLEYSVYLCLSSISIRIRFIQVIILIQFICKNLKIAIDLIGNVAKQENICENLNDIRIVYLKCWRISHLVCECYGWSLLIFTLQFIVDITIGLYWMYAVWGTSDLLGIIWGTKLFKIYSSHSVKRLKLSDVFGYNLPSLIILIAICENSNFMQKLVGKAQKRCRQKFIH